MGTQLPLPQNGGTGPQFSVHVYCGQTIAHLSYCLALVVSVTDVHELVASVWHVSKRTGNCFVYMDLSVKRLNFSI